MAELTKILGFAGSIRHGSYNRALIRTAVELCPQGASIDVFNLDGFPLFSQDYEKNPPPSVVEFKKKIMKSDALLIATPEHNYTIPSVLTNAMEWASRPYGDNSFKNKPVAIMSASTGMIAGARAQYHLRQSLVFLEMFPLNQPEVMVPDCADKIDEGGLVHDELTREKIIELLRALIAWAPVINFMFSTNEE